MIRNGQGHRPGSEGLWFLCEEVRVFFGFLVFCFFPAFPAIVQNQMAQQDLRDMETKKKAAGNQ
jgi:hypothetical protein